MKTLTGFFPFPSKIASNTEIHQERMAVCLEKRYPDSSFLSSCPANIKSDQSETIGVFLLHKCIGEEMNPRSNSNPGDTTSCTGKMGKGKRKGSYSYLSLWETFLACGDTTTGTRRKSEMANLR